MSGNQMWGGRFAASPDAIMEQINASIGFDQRFWRQDIEASLAHCQMLVKQQILTPKEGQKICDGLEQISGEIEAGQFTFKPALEDIHMNIEARLTELIGEVAGKLHTARSRNDQVATDFRLWVRQASDHLAQVMGQLEATLAELSQKHAAHTMPGFTHLQPAQPITLGIHLDAYAQMLSRDAQRLADMRGRVNESPLGAAALAGTPFPIDREATAAALGFDRPMPNTLDAVSARDFAAEFLFVCAMCGTHLSRLAEEIILWSTPQFGYITLSDQWSTGSSIMPQKKNPDAAELVRGKTGRLNGNLVQMLTLIKGLPLAYNKDLQEDKEPVFDSFDALNLCLQAMTGMLQTATFHTDAMRQSCEQGYVMATALADWLVMELNIPFRRAHHITGAIVKLAEQQHCKLDELPLTTLTQVEPRIHAGVYEVLRV